MVRGVAILLLFALGCDQASKPSASRPATAPAKPTLPTLPPSRKADPPPATRVAGAIPTRKTTPKPPPAKATQPAKPPESLAFDEAFADLIAKVPDLKRAGEKELVDADKRRKLFTREQLDRHDAAVRREKLETLPVGDRFILRNVAPSLFQARAIDSCDRDAGFRYVAQVVWNRSPKTRGPQFLSDLVVKWMATEPIERIGISQFFADNMKVRDLNDAEYQKLVVGFAGEEAILNGP